MRFAVIGDPVAHSKSPAMHRAAFAALGLPHTYETIRASASDLPGLVEKLRTGEYEGFNVTVPHKRRILELLQDDLADPSVLAVGAVNTVAHSAGRTLVSYNTDVLALLVELQRLAPDRTPKAWSKSRAIVLGSGGAARAAMAALASLGVTDLVVRARRKDALADISTPLTIEPLAPSASERGALTVVQATSAGMQDAAPGEDIAKAVAWSDLPSDAIALDVIYAPPETPFLRAATARGLRSANGLGMLVEQGALALERWLSTPYLTLTAPRDAMRAALAPAPPQPPYR